MSLLQDILLRVKGSSIEEVVRCLDKASIIIYQDGIFLVADKDYIYYFGSNVKGRKLGEFVKKYKYLASGKIFYSENIEPFKRKVSRVDARRYRWD